MNKDTKKKKPKGPIRFEAIIPVTILFALIFAYFYLFFDSHLKWGMEYGATKAHGAEVNISSVKTSFFKASMTINNIQVTDKKTPAFNIVQIGNISFKALWDGLLRGKVVIPLASITDIQVKTKRSRPGYVYPPSQGGGVLKSVGTSAMDETTKALDGNIFGDVAQVLQGTNYKDQLKKMENELKSSQYITKMEKELKEKEKAWKERIKKLPKNDDFKRLEARAKAIKIDKNNPTSYLTAAKEVDAIYKEADAKVKTIKDSQSALSADMKQYKNIYGDIESQIDKDLNDLQNKMGIPNIDAKDIAMRVFGRQMGANLQNIERYMRTARKYMPPAKKKGGEKKKVEVARAKGRNYHFPKLKSYPKFWLKKAKISSKTSAEGFSGDVSGAIINVTNNQKHLGKPTEIKLTGEFPNSKIYGVKVNGTMDHRTDNPKEFGTIIVGAFPMKDVELSKSSDITYGFKEAQGSSKLNFKLENETVTIGMNSQFDKINYLVEAKKAKVKEILANISQRLGILTVSGKASGSWTDLDLSLRSNLGEKLQDALKEEFNAQVAGYKKKLRTAITQKISGQKEKLMSKVKGFEKDIGISLKDKESAVASLKAKLNEEKKKAKSQQKKKLKDAGKKLLKGLFK